ncbi:MAG: glycosyltransferase family 4 protein, partial [Bacteroidetes bacterium]|nr:glycosyltransferase family 4 protein [Bacteroidota bacterium]
MKVLIVHTYYAERGGEDTVFETECSLLKSAGVSVEKVSFQNKKHQLINILLEPFNPFSYYRIKRHVKKFKPDVMHVHNWHFASSPSVIWAAKVSKVPIVMTLHNYRILCPSAILYHQGDLFLDSLKRGFPWAAVKKRVYKNSFTLSLWLAMVITLHKRLKTWKYVNRFIALSNFAKGVLSRSELKLDDSKIIVKANFVQPNGYAINSTRNKFIYVGRLSDEKGVDLILSAFQISKF